MVVAAPELRPVALRALDEIAADAVVGLGTGRAATTFIQALGERVKAGLKVRGIPTSSVSASFARELGIPLVELADVEQIDVTVDGADEVDPRCNLIKGFGGALIREKIVAASSRKLIILVGADKLVASLGTRGRLPVEVVPFGVPLFRRRLAAMGMHSAIRMEGGNPFTTDNGNQIVDCQVEPIDQPHELEHKLLAIPGVVGTGLFLQMAHLVLIQAGGTVEVRERPATGS